MGVSSEAGVAPVDHSGMAIRGGAIRVSGFVGGVLVSLGSAAILVRHLGISSFGRYVTVTSLVALVAGVTEAGINVYGIREWGLRTGPDRERLLANLLSMRLMLSAAGIACAVCFGLAVGYRQVLVLGTLVAGAGLLVQVVADVLSISLQAQLQLGRLTFVELSRRLLTLAIIAALALLDASLLPFFAASTVAGALALALIAWIVRSSITIRLGFDRQIWRELFAETLPFAVALSVGAIYLYVTVVVMSLLASATQTGLFATSFRVTQVALVVPSLLLTAVFPLMTRAPREHAAQGEIVGKIFNVALICGVWMSLAVGLGAPVLIDLIAGSQARGAVSVLRIQAVILTVSFVSGAMAFNLVSLQRYRPLLIASVAALALNIALALVLVPALGARGGAIADVIAEACMAVALTAAVVRAVPQHQVNAAIAPPLILASALAVAVALVPVGAIARVGAATIIYFGVLALAGAIPDEVLSAAGRARAVWRWPQR
jgi:O-antigen/teichoic acid export membrane protein